MKKKSTFTIDGKEYEMSYEISKEGGRYDIEVTDSDLKKYLTNNFTVYFTNGKFTFLIFNDQIGRIGNQIITQLIKELNI